MLVSGWMRGSQIYICANSTEILELEHVILENRWCHILLSFMKYSKEGITLSMTLKQIY